MVTKKLQIQGINHYSKFYNKSGVVVAEVGDAGELYLTTKLNGIDKIYTFSFLFFIWGSCRLNEGIDLPI